MKTNLFTLAALAMVIATGCSKDEILSSGADPITENTIKFTTYSSTNTAVSKGVPVADNDAFNTDGTSFKVVGYETTGEGSAAVDVSYMDTKTVTYNNSTSAWEYASLMLWPNTAMDFYAIYSPTKSSVLTPTTASTDSTTTGETYVTSLGISSYEVSSTITAQEDLMYAAAADKTSTGDKVNLQFQHALTQINFKIAMGSAYEDMTVEVDAITICNVVSSGGFSFAAKTDTENNICEWTPSTTLVSYPINNTEFAALTSSSSTTDFDDSASTADELMLIPQTLTAWDPEGDYKVTDSSNTGAYVKIDCKLYVGSVYYIGSSSASDSVYIPLASVTDETAETTGTDEYGVSTTYPEWKAGRNITYTITFGANSTTPGGGGYDDEGDPVLNPIEFTATAIDWIEKTGTLDM